MFGAGCDPGFWCAPLNGSYSEPGTCLVNGPLRLGDACSATSECPANAMCDAVCLARCRVNGTPNCTQGTTCTVRALDLAACQ